MKKKKGFILIYLLIIMSVIPVWAIDYPKMLSSTKAIGSYNYYSEAKFIDVIERGRGVSRLSVNSVVRVKAEGYIWNDGTEWLETADSGNKYGEATVYIDFSNTVGCKMITKHYAPSGTQIECFTVANDIGYLH